MLKSSQIKPYVDFEIANIIQYFGKSLKYSSQIFIDLEGKKYLIVFGQNLEITAIVSA